jgi:hypothetical protein
MRRFVAIFTLALAAACGRARPAPAPEEWMVLREDAEQRARLNVAGIRTEPGDLRSATVVLDYAAVREVDDVRYDREWMEVQFDCGRQAARTRGGSNYLEGAFVSIWSEGPEPASWEIVQPGSVLADAMKHVCRTAP